MFISNSFSFIFSADSLEAGWFMFVIMVGFVGILSNFALVTLFRSLKLLSVSSSSYPELGRATFGKLGEQVASWSVTLQQLGAGVAYTVIVADVMVPVLELSGVDILGSRTFVIIIVVVLVIFPLCMLPTMKALSHTSLMSLVTILTFIAVLFSSAMYVITHSERREELEQPGEPIDGDFEWWPDGIDIIKGIPIISFAFLCHQNSFPIYREMRGASVPKIAKVSTISMLLCAVGYLLCGTSGYLIFLNRTDSDLLVVSHDTFHHSLHRLHYAES